MDNRQDKVLGFSLCAAMVGRYLLIYKQRFNSIPSQLEITDFCAKIMVKYDGTFCDINSPQTEELITRCMMQAREFVHGKEHAA